ncbi:MAG: CDP-alcohol phosphatidyltransferase family protein [Actinomadura sp.]
MATFSLDDVRDVCKKRDAWWTVFLVDPPAIRLTRFLANRTSITPNQITVGSVALGAFSACCFVLATPRMLVLGALFYHLSFVLDCCDGKVARLKGTGTLFGQWLDFMLDQFRVVCCALALSIGQYAATGQVAYLYLGFVIICLDVFRYLNSAQVAKTRRAMRHQVNVAVQEQEALEVASGVIGPQPQLSERQLSYIEDTLRESPDAGDRRVDLHREFDSRFPWYRGLRQFMLRRRVRTHLISGIEFQMAAFVIAPPAAAALGGGAMFPVTLGVGALLLLMELVIIYKLLLQTRECRRVMDKLTRPWPPPSVPEQRSLSIVGAGDPHRN